MNKIIITGCDYSSYKISPENETLQKIKDVVNNFFKDINDNDLTQNIVNFNPTGQNDKKAEKSKYKLTGGITEDTTEDKTFAGVVGTYRNPSYKYEDNIYDIEVRITSRFDEEEQPKSKPFFLVAMMLAYIEEEYDLKLSENEIPSDNINNLFDFLKICIFRNKLISAYQKGFYKQYTYFQRNDAKLRGRIDVSRHIKLNMGMNNGRIAYEYRENTVDNPINHLILITYHVLQEKYPNYTTCILAREDSTGENACQILQSLEYMMSDYKDKSIGEIIRKSRPSIRHPYFSEYEELRKVCLDILNDVLDISPYTDEEENEVQSMLFYVPDLWEVCIYHFLKDVLKEKYEDWSIAQQDEVPLLRDRKRYVFNSEGPKTKKIIGKKRPDFVLKCNGEAQAVLDAKFKPSWQNLKDNTKNLQDNTIWLQPDIEQCITYAMLKNTDYTGTIFPLKYEPNDELETRIDAYQIGDSNKIFVACGVLVPEIKKEDSFENWHDKLKDEFKKFACILLND